MSFFDTNKDDRLGAIDQPPLGRVFAIADSGPFLLISNPDWLGKFSALLQNQVNVNMQFQCTSLHHLQN